MAKLTRKESQEATRSRLRAATRAEIARRGVGGVSIDRISAAAGFSRGAFYANYAGKHDVLFELLGELHEDEVRIWRQLIEEANDLDRLLAKLEQAFDAYALTGSQWMLSAELQLEAVRDPAFAASFERYERSSLAALEQAISLLLGKFAPRHLADSDKVVSALRALATGLRFQFRPGPVDADRAPGRILAFYLRTLLAGDAAGDSAEPGNLYAEWASGQATTDDPHQ